MDMTRKLILKNQENHKLHTVAVLMATAVALTVYAYIVQKNETIFTHFYYLPIILSSLWWGRKGIVSSLALSGFLIFIHFPAGIPLEAHDFCRISMFIVISIFVAFLGEKMDKTKAELREQEKKFRSLFESANDAIFILKGNIITECNQKALDMFGYAREQIIGLSLMKFSPERQPDGTLSSELGIEKAIELSRGEPRSFEWQHIRIDGALVDTEVSLNRIELKGAQFIQAIVRDITERKRAEKALIDNEAKLRIIFETSLDCIITVDAKGLVTFWNAAAEKIFGYSKEEAMGRRVHTLIAPERFMTNWKTDFNNFGQTGEGTAIGKTIEINGKRKDGTEFPLEFSIWRFWENEQWNAVTFAREITDRRHAEEALLQAKKEAETANKAKSEFLASMSHEIRTPMNAIIGMAELLSETHLTLEQQRYIKVFREAGENLLGLINDILDLSKVEAGQIYLESIPFNLEELVEKTCEIMSVRAHHKGLELMCHIPNAIPFRLMGDPSRLRQILVNLISNSIKFTEKGEIVVTVERREGPGVSEEGRGPEVSREGFGGDGGEALDSKSESLAFHFSVSDSGIGIQEEKVKIIFDKFTQADSSTTRKYGGTGLGLTITKRLVELMGGSIWLKSAVNHGTTVYFTAEFPVQKRPLEPQERFIDVGVDLKELNALIIDDNATNRMILREMLGNWGMSSIETDGGISALKELRERANTKRPIDMVLLDFSMPGMDGFQVAQAIKEDPLISETTIILLSSIIDRNETGKLKSIGVVDILYKPIKKTDLKEGIMRAVMRYRPHEEEEVRPISAPTTTQPARPMKILLAEDNEDNRLLIWSYFKNTPHQIVFAETGRAAYEKFKGGKFDLVYMDIQMPVMDGYTATRLIRQWERETGADKTPIVALTAYALNEDTQKSIDAGCNGHLTKPIKKSTLLRSIAEFCRIEQDNKGDPP